MKIKIFEQDLDQKNIERSTEIHIEILILRLGSLLNRENGAVVTALQRSYFVGFVMAYLSAGLISSEECDRILARADRMIESYDLEAAALDVANAKKTQASIKPLGKIRL